MFVIFRAFPNVFISFAYTMFCHCLFYELFFMSNPSKQLALINVQVD